MKRHFSVNREIHWKKHIQFDTINSNSFIFIKIEVKHLKIKSIEPTPSPHSMKINVTEKLEDGKSLNVKKDDDLSNVPSYIKALFEIDGIINIYRVVDFITIARHPKSRWEDILPEVKKVIGTTETAEEISMEQVRDVSGDDSFGEVRVFVQMFRGIPMQVKLEDAQGEHRFGLPEYFANVVMEASAEVPTFIMERKWVEQDHVRYGKVDDIGEEVVEELTASYDQKRLKTLVQLAKNNELEKSTVTAEDNEMTLETLNDPDWKVRYAALDRLDPTLDHLSILKKALDDSKSSIRRLATAYLGMIEDKQVLPALYKALKDKAANVRRTAGDCLSDLGFIEAMPEMIKTLKDNNRIVRWRAAMFLYEIGDESAIEPLEQAMEEEPEFEVRMQMNMALDRIKGGEEAQGSIWQQMTEATKQD